MTHSDTNETGLKTASTINLLAGIWLFISPWVYRMQSVPSAWNSWIVGALIAILAIIRMSNPVGTRGISVVNLLLGIWVFASPWIYGYTGATDRFINSLCVGVIVFIAGLAASSMSHPTTAPPTPLHT